MIMVRRQTPSEIGGVREVNMNTTYTMNPSRRDWIRHEETGSVTKRLDPSRRDWIRHEETGSVTKRLDPSRRDWIRHEETGSVTKRLDPSRRDWIRHEETGPYRGVAVCVPRRPIELHWGVPA
ncbi:hypothetical protein CSKR_201519 [Clonorchis sinensis]|uniref:Uncharacterized protein n=1 Tax=Clonorchis sinensis TaxID=79923 RepID=A0A8T1MSC0_CLOSI|nr:hypothetical protein CSKR_201519 [Clonorchis sinensis]